MAHPGGRPREYDRKEVAQQLLEWVAKEDSTNINGFVGDYLIPYSRIWQFAQEDPEFREILDIVKSKIGVRREAWVNAKLLHPTAYGLNARVYDKAMHQYYREDAKYLSDLRKEEGQAVPKESEEKLDAMMRQVNQMQEESKAALSSVSKDK